MGRPGLTQHRKFRRLARTLGSALVARGAVEFMWDTCYENGDEFLGDSADVEAAARWDGESGRLTKALLDAGGGDGQGFIEEVAGRSGRYMVHDLWHHAPDYVRKRRAREDERRRKSDPIVPTTTDSTMASQSPPSNGQYTLSPDCQTGVDLPPAPAPAPAPNKTMSSKPEGFDAALEEIWNYYLEKLGKNRHLYRFTDQRRRKGKARLEECCRIAAEPKLESAMALMKVCIDRLAASAFHNGDNRDGKKYLDWNHLFRSHEKLVYWLDDDLHSGREK